MAKKRQLSLFGESESNRLDRTASLAPAEVPAELREVSRRLPPAIHLGTSSWSFPGWAGLVYERATSKARLAREGLAVYAQHPLLRAVGIDRTFYAPISAADFARYAAAVPPDFRFLVKAGSQVTSTRSPRGENPLFLHVGYAVHEIVGPFLEGLQDREAVLLFQFPPLGAATTREPGRFAERLAAFLEALPRDVRYAVELRDRRLFGPDYFAALRSGGAFHCLSLHPRMPSLAEQWRAVGEQSPDWLLVRWMLHSGRAYEEAVRQYQPFAELIDEDPANRALLATICRSAVRRGRDALVIVNNKAEGSAPRSVFKLAELIVALD